MIRFSLRSSVVLTALELKETLQAPQGRKTIQLRGMSKDFRDGFESQATSADP